MEPVERETFLKLLIGAAELYGKEISGVLVKLYWQILESYPLEDVSKAFMSHFKDPNSGQFMPKPADIIRVINGDTQSLGLQAWTKVEQAIRLVGPYRTVVFDDPVIHAVLQDMGGWLKLCQVAKKDLPFTAKEFQTRYEGYRYKPPSVYPRKLTGLIEHQNTMQGYDIEPVYLLGNVKKSRLVLEQGKEASKLNKCYQTIPKLIAKVGTINARTTKIVGQA